MKKVITLLTILMMVVLAACADGGAEEEAEELAILDVDFNFPDTAEPGETVELEAVVTYGGEPVLEADEVLFEYWLTGHEDDSDSIEGEHTENGSYVADVTFPEDGVYEMFAHTTAEGLHTMPLESIIIGDGGDEAAEKETDADDHNNKEGFHSHFMEPESIVAGEETDLIVHLQLDGEELTDVSVRFEVSPEENTGGTEWVDAEETIEGEYAASHTFEDVGPYTIVVHVEGDADLHEQDHYKVEVE